MGIGAASAAARSAFRSSSSVRTAASRLASQPKPAPRSSSSPFRVPSASRPPLLSQRFISRSPVELSACVVESMQPYHTATASALLTSMLNVSRCGFGWLPEAGNDDV